MSGYVNYELWIHDLDSWRNSWFDYPHFKDVSICEYSEYDRSKFNSGSVFYEPTARDIVVIVSFLLCNKKRRTRIERSSV